MRKWTREESKHSRERQVRYVSPCGGYTISKLYVTGFDYNWGFEKKNYSSSYDEVLYTNDSFKEVKKFANNYLRGENHV